MANFWDAQTSHIAKISCLTKRIKKLLANVQSVVATWLQESPKKAKLSSHVQIILSASL